MRFGVLKKQVEGISARVLTERLRILEEKGFVFRHYQPTIPPAVTYGITGRMKDIEKVLHQLEGLARKWQAEGTTTSGVAVCRPQTPACTRIQPHKRAAPQGRPFKPKPLSSRREQAIT